MLFHLFCPQKVLVFRAPSHVLSRQRSSTSKGSCFKRYLLVFLIYINIYFTQKNEINSGSAKHGREQRTHWILFFELGPSPVADASLGSQVTTIKRAFSLLKSTTPNESFVGPAIPVHQIVSLVSMTSPRTFRPQTVSASPAFVEFNMSEDGYGWVLVLALFCAVINTTDHWSDHRKWLQAFLRYCIHMTWGCPPKWTYLFLSAS